MRHNLSQAALARLLGVSRLTVIRWETEKQKPPPYLSLTLRCLEIQLKEVKDGENH